MRLEALMEAVRSGLNTAESFLEFLHKRSANPSQMLARSINDCKSCEA
jgi:hypothetical protein